MVAVVLGWLYAGEALTARTVAAAAIIIAGVILVISFRDRRSRAASPRDSAPPETALEAGATSTPNS